MSLAQKRPMSRYKFKKKLKHHQYKVCLAPLCWRFFVTLFASLNFSINFFLASTTDLGRSADITVPFSFPDFEKTFSLSGYRRNLTIICRSLVRPGFDISRFCAHAVIRYFRRRQCLGCFSKSQLKLRMDSLYHQTARVCNRTVDSLLWYVSIYVLQ